MALCSDLWRKSSFPYFSASFYEKHFWNSNQTLAREYSRVLDLVSYSCLQLWASFDYSSAMQQTRTAYIAIKNISVRFLRFEAYAILTYLYVLIKLLSVVRIGWTKYDLKHVFYMFSNLSFILGTIIRSSQKHSSIYITQRVE